MTQRLAGRTAIITGAGGGQGAAAAVRFASEGANVVVSDIDGVNAELVAERIRGDGGGAIAVPCDVAQGDGVRDLIAQAVREFGHVDVLYNNAGTETGDADAPDLAEEAWDRIQAVNIKSVYLLCHYGIPELLERGGGSIINVSSVGGLVGAPGLSSYTASKGAVIALTRTLAVTYASRRIRANAICPGLVMTPMVERIGDEFINGAIAATPLGRGAQPEEIAGVAAFLASDDASFITGATIAVDGGLTAR